MRTNSSSIQRPFRGYKTYWPVITGRSTREIAFRGLMNCAHDGCMLTGDVQKEKYIYYRCTGNCGKCDLPRFREEVLADRLGEPLKGVRVPPEIVAQIVDILREDRMHEESKLSAERTRLDSRLMLIRNRMDAAYADKLGRQDPGGLLGTQDD